ncbi:MAG: phosphoribosylformylglycinamidine synthase subunit PurL [Clostridia bacterium]|nr:MAG: phosphoribosylformylglycinamidine synthase subunit PurL [Clostridia bacterium]
MSDRPWEEVGLTETEYEQITEILGRRPNELELGMFGVMWSEHCSYKSSRPVLRLFPYEAPWVLQGPGENAGVIAIGDGRAVVFKMESHNHPSAIEPFQGAATGVGGIVRDIFAMGARPIALLDSLRFGSLEDPRVRYLFSGVVGGISWYGNCIGVPTVGGEIYFDTAYATNPLVNVMCVGLLSEDKTARAVASGPGNKVMLVGARTGRDGIHGASFASEELGEDSLRRRPAVQVGDPFKEKLLIEACLELVDRGCLVGLQDLGAAGITSAASEMAGRAGTGMEIDVTLVPRREEGMTPYEVMISESQERMLAVPQPGREEEVAEILAKWDLEAAVIGQVTSDGMFRVRDAGRVVAEVPVEALAACPVIPREKARPAYLEEQATGAEEVPEPDDYGVALLNLLSSPTIAGKAWVWRQYDHMVQINTAVRPGAADAAVLRLKGSRQGLALTTDGNGRYTYLDPYTGGAIAVAEAARNLACCGARPLGVTDCLNFGHPGRPEIFWQFEEAVRGMAEACRALGVPVVSGNVSFYNESSGEAVYPTPVVGMVGLVEDMERPCTMAFTNDGDLVVLLGENTGELGGSEYLWLAAGRPGARPPRVDLAREKALVEVLVQAVGTGLLTAAHDCAEGGLAVALAECCLAGGRGARVKVTSSGSLAALLFGEGQGRAVVSLPEANWPRLEELCQGQGLSVQVLGRVGGGALEIKAGDRVLVQVPVEELRTRWEGAIPCLMS